MKTTSVINAGGIVIATVPKAASGSIKIAVLEGLGVAVEDRFHSSPALNLTAPGDHNREWPAYAFIRHPLERLASVWADKIARRTRGSNDLKNVGFRLGVSFRKFVDDLHRWKDRDLHTVSQTSRLVPNATIYRYENLARGWELIRERHTWLKPIRSSNESGRAPVNELATHAIARRVELLYAEDLELWEGLCDLR